MARILLMAVLAVALITIIVRSLLPPPAAIGMAGMQHTAGNVRFLHDDSWLNEQDERQLSQQVFDEVFRLIDQAQRLVVLDMFLFNAWQGPLPETYRALSGELTDRLIQRSQQMPGLHLIVISDPINTVYGGLESVHFERLRESGIPVVLTELSALQDSNPVWSGFWRLFIQPWGNSAGQLLPNPFGAGRVSLRSYLALLNFKANHRKLLVVDGPDGELHALVTSANPHDGSSAHRNVALSFSGGAAMDLLAAERELLIMSQAHAQVRLLDEVVATIGLSIPQSGQRVAAAVAEPSLSFSGPPSVQVLGESRILDAVLEALAASGAGDRVNLAMFYLSDRAVVKALTAAASRGVLVRVLLDVNKDAFGREKNGVPNRPVAAELHAAGVSVRWCATTGEQCHAKWLQVSYGSAEHRFVLGSANFTRRNLRDLNMETNVQVRTVADAELARQMTEFFDRQWDNADGRTYSVDYEQFADDSLWLKLQYRFMEFSGLSTF